MPTACPRDGSRHAWASCAERCAGLPELHLYLAPDERSLPAVNLERLADWIETVVADADLARATREAARAAGSYVDACIATHALVGQRLDQARAVLGAGADLAARGHAERHVKRAHAGARRRFCALPVAAQEMVVKGAVAYTDVLRYDYDGDGKRDRVQFWLEFDGHSAVGMPGTSGYKPAAGSVRYTLQGRRRREEGRQVARWARHGRRAQGHAVPDDRPRVRRQDRAFRCVRNALDRRRRRRWLRSTTRSSSTTASGRRR